MTDTPTPFDGVIAEVQKRRDGWSVWVVGRSHRQTEATNYCHEDDVLLSILHRHRDAWLASQPAALTPPAGESVDDIELERLELRQTMAIIAASCSIQNKTEALRKIRKLAADACERHAEKEQGK